MGKCVVRINFSFVLRAILFLAMLTLASCSERRKPEGKLPLGGVNVPVSSQKINGKVDVVGWALAEGGIESVSIFVDRSFVANCSMGLPRPDVAKVYPSMPGSDNAGWTATLDTAGL